VQDVSFKQQTKQKHKASHQQVGLPPHSVLPIRGKTNKQTKTQHSPGSMQDTGYLGLVHWDDPEGWYREGGGRGFRMGNTYTPVADSC